MESYEQKRKSERVCGIMYRAAMTVIALALAASVAMAAVRYFGTPKIGRTYYSVTMDTDFTEDTVFVRPLEVRGRYVRYGFWRRGTDTLESVCPIFDFNASHFRYNNR